MIQVMNPQGISSPSFFSDGFCFSDERQFGLAKKGHMSGFSIEVPSNYAGSNGAPDSIASHYRESFESLEEVEPQAIGNLLPDDDDLFSGVTDGFGTRDNGEETEELDLFSSVGGLELGEDGNTFSLGANYGEDHPSRTLFVRNINSNIEDSELTALFEQYGDIRNLFTGCKHRGFVMISYFDIRAACSAMKALQNKPLRRRKLDIHFSIPKENLSEQDVNQGALAIFNFDASVSNDELLEVFGVYGEVKEIRETPRWSNHRFVEFYDVRAAQAALCALKKIEIAGKKIQLEPCGFSDNGTMLGSMADHVIHPGVSSCASNNLPSLLRADPVKPACITDYGHIRNHLKFEIQSPNFDVHSLPEYSSAFSNGGHIGGSPSNVAANFSCRIPEMIDGQQFGRVVPNLQPLETEVFGFAASGNCSPCYNYMWSNSHLRQPQAILWPNSPSFVAISRDPHSTISVLPMKNTHHIGSAPSVNPTLWDGHNPYAGESLDASVFHPRSPGKMRVSGNFFSHTGANGLHPHEQRCMIFLARANDRSRHHRNEVNLSQSDNKKQQFDLDVERILRGEDNRTTLMIKNIPNKYTSKMLLAAIDERHKGTYDFIYLPIDFKNKCNVGYAFINMTEPSLIVPFHKTINGKKWEKFNSEKVAYLAYARIQGKAALISHFQNSSLMNEDKRCRPILFHTDGPNAGDQVPFPIGTNIRTRPGKLRTGTSLGESALNSVGDDCSNGESSGSAKDSD